MYGIHTFRRISSLSDSFKRTSSISCATFSSTLCRRRGYIKNNFELNIYCSYKKNIYIYMYYIFIKLLTAPGTKKLE